LGAHILGLEICRELRDSGYSVVVVGDKGKAGNLAMSAAGVKGLAMASPTSNAEELCRELLELGRETTGKKVLICSNETYCAWLADNIKAMEECYIFLSNQPELLGSLNDKYKQYGLFYGAGFDVPKTQLACDLNSNEVGLAYPVIIKPRYSYETLGFREKFGCKVFVASNLIQLRAYVRLSEEAGYNVIIQNNVPGPDENQYFWGGVCRDGVAYSICLAQKLKVDPSPNGSGMIIKTIADPVLLELGKKVTAGMNYSGICDIEFKIDFKTGKYQLIEFNPRYGMGQKVMQMAGKTSPEIYVRILSGGINEKTALGEPGYYWIYFDEWAKGIIMPWRNRRFRKRMNKGNTVRTFHLGDCLPECRHVMGLLKLKMKRSLGK